MSMERIIRPFQLSSVAPARRVIAVEKPVENAVLNIGKVGSGLQFTYNLFFFFDFTVQDTNRTEVQRTEITKRITNPDDTSQHVDVKRMTSVTTRSDTNPADHQKITFTGA